jgi:hypothetical protein
MPSNFEGKIVPMPPKASDASAETFEAEVMAIRSILLPTRGPRKRSSYGIPLTTSIGTF